MIRVTSPTIACAGLSLALALGIQPLAAQEAPAPAAPAAVQPETAVPADPAAPAPAAAPEASAAAPAPAAPPPTLPTTGDGAVVTTLLSKVCQPLLNGGNRDQLAKAAGMRKENRTDRYIHPLSARGYQVILEPAGTNPNVCAMTVQYPPGWDQPIVEALNVWRFLHKPQLFGERNDVGTYQDAVARTTLAWDNRANLAADNKMIGLVFSKRTNPDGSPINPRYAEASVLYSIR